MSATSPIPTPETHCLNCTHHRFNQKGLECHHPQRPEDKREVVRWFRGCPQHQKEQ